jgi:hypothetical protein
MTSLRKNRVFRDEQHLETTEVPQGLVLNLARTSARTSAFRSLRATNWAMARSHSETTKELHITGNMTASRMLQSPGWVWGIWFGGVEFCMCTGSIKTFQQKGEVTVYQYCSLLRVGYPVAQLVEALRHMPEVRGFDSRWGNWDFSLT